MSEPVTLESLPTVLESILFVADKPVEIGLLSRVTGHGADVIGLVVDEIAADWQGRGVRIQRSGTAVQMVTAIEKILGKSCDYSVAALKARELITEVGRSNGPGRPYLYGTTFRLLEHFGLEKPEDLPPLPELDLAAAVAETAEDGAEIEAIEVEDEPPEIKAAEDG